MTEHPIIFSKPMILAILAGRKTQTRRIITERHFKANKGCNWQRDSRNIEIELRDGIWTAYLKKYPGVCIGTLRCPYGKPSDVLAIKEGYQITSGHFESCTVEGFYLADEMPFERGLTADEWGLWSHRKKPYQGTSGRFMYKSLCRLKPPVVNVKVERVQDISGKDAKAEGIVLVGDELVFNNREQKQSLLKTKFARLWNSIHGQDAWDRNDWLWVPEFEKQV